jgi:hypothetical protein
MGPNPQSGLLLGPSPGSEANEESGRGSAADMFAAVQIRERWRELQRGRPGRRFQDWYERARGSTRPMGAVRRIAFFVLAVLCLAIGLVLVVIPGPAIPFLLISGGLLALESRPIAKAMDWAEIQTRGVWRWGLRRWLRLPPAARVTLLLCAGCVSAASAYFLFQLLRS